MRPAATHIAVLPAVVAVATAALAGPATGATAPGRAHAAAAMRHPHARTAHADPHVLRRLMRRGVSVRSAGGSRRVVALTFDDGPGPSTPKVLAELRRLHVPATFFMLGRAVKGHPQWARQVARAGMQIGDHSWNHPDMRHLTPRTRYDQLLWTTNAIRTRTRVHSRLFRAPYGAINAGVITAAQRMRQTSILWDVDPQDWRGIGSSAIAARVVAATTPGSIILLHDGGGDRAHTVAAIAPIVKRLRARGYRFSTVSRLLINDPPKRRDVVRDGRPIGDYR